MKRNNDENAGQQSAMERLFKVPIVRSAYAKLSVLYLDTKRSHPTINSVLDVLESRTKDAVDQVSPLIAKLEPQVSFANNVACKSLDWLETSFSLLLSPTERFVASVENNMLKIPDVVSTAVQNTVTWIIVRMNRDGECSLMKRAFSVTEEGLGSILSLLEVWLDQVLPLVEDEAHSVEGFDVAKVKGRYPERLFSLAAKVSQRTYRLVVLKVLNPIPTPSVLAQNLLSQCLTLIWRVPWLPQHLQRQALITVYFIVHMCNLGWPSSKQEPANQVQSCINSTMHTPAQPKVDHVMGQFAAAHLVRSTRVFRFTRKSYVKESVGH